VLDGGDSTFSTLSAIQTFARIYEPVAGLAQYHHSWWDALTGDQANDTVLGASTDSTDKKDLTTAKGLVTAVEADDCTVANSHFAKQLRIDYDDLTGKKIRPNMVQYRVLCGGKGGAYAYAIGVFGDGDGLPAGTGYAVIEICNPKQRIKRVGTWERYKAIDNSGKQVIFAASGNANEAGSYKDIDGNAVTADNANESNLCFLGNPDVYLNLDEQQSETAVQAALGELTKAGWVFN
jgi:hypothetical protein